MKYLILTIVLLLGACTDAEKSYFNSIGEEAQIICVSGGRIVLDTTSTGKVMVLEGGGWAFRTKDGALIQTFADCFVIVAPEENK